jgi:hypothetical protein
MITPYEYINRHLNVKLEPSRIDGVGVFAIRDIEQGETLFVEWEGETGEYTLTNEEFGSLDDNIKKHILDMYGYKDIEGEFKVFFFLNKNCHWIYKTPLHWMNSCDWNGEPNFDVTTHKTKRFIKKGEEILTKYGKYNKFKRTGII